MRPGIDNAKPGLDNWNNETTYITALNFTASSDPLVTVAIIKEKLKLKHTTYEYFVPNTNPYGDISQLKSIAQSAETDFYPGAF